MNRSEYIESVKNELGFMSQDEIVKAEEYFNSFFCGSLSDEEVINGLGTPKEAAKRYCKANTEQKTDSSLQSASRSYTGVIIAIIAAVFLFPIWLPVLILSVLLIFAILIFVIAASFGMWLGGGVVIISGLLSHGIALADKLLYCGGGFIMFGVGLILSWLLIRTFIALVVWIVRKITHS